MAHAVQPSSTGRISNNRAVDLPAPGLQPPRALMQRYIQINASKTSHIIHARDWQRPI